MTKVCLETFVSIIKAILTLIQKMYTSDVKFNWQSFSEFAIDLKSLMRIKMCISARIVWTMKFSNFLTLMCNNLIFCSRLKFSLKIKRFSSRCFLKKKCRCCFCDWCRLTFLYIYLKNTDFLRSCIATWCVWIQLILRSSVIDFCTKCFYSYNDDSF